MPDAPHRTVAPEGMPLDEVHPTPPPRAPRRVLMLTKGLGRGGAERLLVGTARHMDRARFAVEMAYLLPWKDAFVADIEAAGIPVHCLDAPKPHDLGWLRRLRHLVRDRGVDLVHSHMPLPAAQARLALAGGDAPAFVHTEHNLWDRYRWPTRWINAVTYRRNAAAIAVSHGVAASIRSRVPVETVIHGLDLEALPRDGDARLRARTLLGAPGVPVGEEVPVIGTVGNLTAKKDQTSLLRAFATARAAGHDNALLVVVGTGPLESDLRREARRLGIAGAVRFLGLRDDVFDLLGGLDVFVLSSRYEGLPISLLEAMACGVPPVATSVGGIPEVVTDRRDGLLVPAGDDRALGAALSEVLGDDRLRGALGAAARTRAADFDLPRAVRAIEGIYDRVLGERS